MTRMKLKLLAIHLFITAQGGWSFWEICVRRVRKNKKCGLKIKHIFNSTAVLSSTFEICISLSSLLLLLLFFPSGHRLPKCLKPSIFNLRTSFTSLRISPFFFFNHKLRITLKFIWCPGLSWLIVMEKETGVTEQNVKWLERKYYLFSFR